MERRKESLERKARERSDVIYYSGRFLIKIDRSLSETGSRLTAIYPPVHSTTMYTKRKSSKCSLRSKQRLPIPVPVPLNHSYQQRLSLIQLLRFDVCSLYVSYSHITMCIVHNPIRSSLLDYSQQQWLYLILSYRHFGRVRLVTAHSNRRGRV